MSIIATIEETPAERESRILASFTPKQRRWVLRRQQGLFRLLTSAAKFDEKVKQFKQEAQERQAEEFADSQRAYFATISRVVGYDGPDYRVRFHGQKSFIRATEQQYKDSLRFAMERSIGVPELADLKALAA